MSANRIVILQGFAITRSEFFCRWLYFQQLTLISTRFNDCIGDTMDLRSDLRLTIGLHIGQKMTVLSS